MKTVERLFAAIAVGLTLAACSASMSVGTATIDKEQLQSEVQSQLSDAVGQEAPPIICPGDLEAKVGESMTCTLTDDSGTYDVAVDITSVEDGTAKFDIQVADEPNP